MTHIPLLSVQNLRVSLETAQGQIEALQLSEQIEKNPTIVAMLQEDKRHAKAVR